MTFENGKYYHLYNRSNNKEIVFREEENYTYFLEQYKKIASPYFSLFAYCLMPTHFHFLVRARTESENINKSIGVWLSAYTKAINKRFNRQGSLFQPHTKAKLINVESYLITLITYIHQNPVRAKMVQHCSDWKHSSFQIYTGTRTDGLIDTSLLLQYFKTPEAYADEMLESIKEEFWI